MYRVSTFTAEEQLRYSRHALLPEFGEAGQARLKAGRVLVVGAGGLGSPASLYLAAAGVGTLGLVDFDTVDLSNLQRQVLYGTGDVGKSKLDTAAARLADINPHIRIVRHADALKAANARAIIRDYDVVIDGTDNFGTRYLVNDACVLERRPNVYGSVFRFEGQAAVFAAPGGPCYRCLHPEPPPAGLIPNCAEGGVLGVLPGVIGTIQATEAIKLLTGVGETLVGRLLLYDALKMRVRQIHLPRDPECPVCGDTPRIREVSDLDLTCAPGAEAGAGEGEMTVDELHQWREEQRPHVLIDVREPSEHEQSRIDGARLIPLRHLQSHVKDLPRDVPVVVHCQSGGRSAIATAMLKVQGIDARNLSGGIKAWKKRTQEL
jgi:molybdopterin/thiamine biosynthesis adenylyltransferase/rhodanese-related sulfurtransferase